MKTGGQFSNLQAMNLRPIRPVPALAGTALFVLTAALVGTGALSFVDRYAVAHLMPWLRPRGGSLTLASLTIPTPRGSLASGLLDIWVYPASVLPSGLLVLLAAWALHRRGEVAAAIRWCALWVAANVIELIGKGLVSRPALYWHGMHVSVFDHSLPSGHTLRSLTVAAALASTWHRGRLALVWAVTVVLILVPLGWHTPTDVAAGVFAAVALWGWAPLPSRSRG
jgi:membrane-associated phospholipid phosphatase